ncbi:hypothetical protein FX988_04094 [Paraglaciecola mesophila]|uniref:Uncharacterized protein n=1 Tax=Paraglaciecola mesophila TaxID=197222 RepID=A0A857JT24_9ALTE|nr:hypothetical protein [Paraglaciecola mesophila]QHJ13814.1 hypothetical protein FX988_04094 [Paraglaciecola mesophila]
MRLLSILFLVSFYSHSNSYYEEISCPAFDESTAIQLEPEKSYFKDDVRHRATVEKVTGEQLLDFHKQFVMHERPIQLSLNKELANQLRVKVVYRMRYYREKYRSAKNHITTHDIVAPVVFETQYGLLAGDSRGEFGGELVFIDKGGEVQILQDMNVEDIYKFSFGYVITEGLGHMMSNNGAIYLVHFVQGKPEIEKLHGLIGAPKSSLKLLSGDLLINTDHGSQLLKRNGALIRVRCVDS